MVPVPVRTGGNGGGGGGGGDYFWYGTGTGREHDPTCRLSRTREPVLGTCGDRGRWSGTEKPREWARVGP